MKFDAGEIRVEPIPGCRAIRLTFADIMWELESDSARVVAAAMLKVADMADRKAAGTQ